MGIYERNYYREESDLILAPSWNQRSAVSVLIIANVAVFVANALFSPAVMSRGDQGGINEFLLLSPSDLYHPLNLWRVVTYGFTHDASNIMHLVFNMLGLYFLGRSVEDRYGTSEFYRIYFGALVICGFCWLIKHALLGQNSRLLGASGAVICIEMLFVFNFPTAKVILLVFPVPAWVLGIILVLSNLANQPGSQVAYDVHVIGIVCAAVYFFMGLDFRWMGNISGAWRRSVRKWTGPKLKIHSLDSKQDDAAEADRILSKIHEFGQDSLSSKERKFLENYSRSVRARKENL